jgi:hypothetical protein
MYVRNNFYLCDAGQPADIDQNHIKPFIMKKTVLLLFVVFIATINVCAQIQTNEEVLSVKSDSTFVYQLFPTKNMWTFLKLNTRTGQIWQVQYSTEGESYRFEIYLNLLTLVYKDEEVNGRFNLYPTQNTYNFILLDQIDGRVWQVQWSQKAENRGIWPID